MQPPPRPRLLEDPALRWLAIGLTVAVALPVWTVEFPPLQDYPYHLARQQILAHWGDADAGYGEVFRRDLFPTPYALVDWLVAGLAQAMPVTLAGRLVLTLYLVAFPWSVFFLVRAVDPRREAVGFLGFLLAPNWYFHMGFVNYVLSWPAALVALGWWAASRERAWGRRTAGLAACLLLVWLLHLYSFAIVLALLAVLALFEPRRLRALAAVAVAALPALALGGALLLREAGGAAGGAERHAWILLYGGLRRKVVQALGALPSYDLAWEGALFGLAGLLAVALLVVGLRRRPTPWPWMAAAVAMVLLYLALPDHVGEVFFVSNRVPPFALFAALPLLAPPAERWGPRAVAGAFALLALAHLLVLADRYRRIDERLAVYAAALDTLPPAARVQFRVDRQAMAEGRVAPAAIFGGMHYLRARPDRIPDLEHFVGFLRPIAYRERSGETMSTAAVRDPAELAAVFGRRFLVDVGGGALVLGGEDRPAVVAEAEEWGFRPVSLPGPAVLLVKTRPVFSAALPPESAAGGRFYVTGYENGADHLVVFGAAGAELAAPGPGWVASAAGDGVRVFRRAPAAPPRPALRAPPPAERAPAAAGGRAAVAGPPR